jgi:hypothetical protein
MERIPEGATMRTAVLPGSAIPIAQRSPLAGAAAAHELAARRTSGKVLLLG